MSGAEINRRSFLRRAAVYTPPALLVGKVLLDGTVASAKLSEPTSEHSGDPTGSDPTGSDPGGDPTGSDSGDPGGDPGGDSGGDPGGDPTGSDSGGDPGGDPTGSDSGGPGNSNRPFDTPPGKNGQPDVSGPPDHAKAHGRRRRDGSASDSGA